MITAKEFQNLLCVPETQAPAWNARRKSGEMVEPIPGSTFHDVDFVGADLSETHFQDCQFEHCTFDECDLSAASFADCTFHHVTFTNCTLRQTLFPNSVIATTQIARCTLSEVTFNTRELRHARFTNCELDDSRFYRSAIGTSFADCVIKSCDFSDVNLSQAEFHGVEFVDTRFDLAVFDGKTAFQYCSLDRKTTFTGAGLANARMMPEFRAAAERNDRQQMWARWCADQKLAAYPARLFWHFSDYGSSTGRLWLWFLGLALVFAGIYYAPHFACKVTGEDVMPFVTGLEGSGGVETPEWCIPVRALYFSIVTMTTLGFGDIDAYPANPWGHIFLTIQVMLGYILLGGLITRFAIMFQDV